MNNNLTYQESEPGAMTKLYAALGNAMANFPDLPRTATGQISKDRKFQYAPYHKVQLYPYTAKILKFRVYLKDAIR